MSAWSKQRPAVDSDEIPQEPSPRDRTRDELQFWINAVGSPLLVVERRSLVARSGNRAAETMFGMSADDDGSRTDPLMRNMPACNAFVPDVEALRAMGDRLVIAYGAESGDQLAARGGKAVAAEVGIEPTEFPSHHGGFLGGEYGQRGEPDAFAARLREVLDR